MLLRALDVQSRSTTVEVEVEVEVCMVRRAGRGCWRTEQKYKKGTAGAGLTGMGPRGYARGARHAGRVVASGRLMTWFGRFYGRGI
jgi:hypothetical protein